MPWPISLALIALGGMVAWKLGDLSTSLVELLPGLKGWLTPAAVVLILVLIGIESHHFGRIIDLLDRNRRNREDR